MNLKAGKAAKWGSLSFLANRLAGGTAWFSAIGQPREQSTLHQFVAKFFNHSLHIVECNLLSGKNPAS
jgi:hypothetical protein